MQSSLGTRALDDRTHIQPALVNSDMTQYSKALYNIQKLSFNRSRRLSEILHVMGTLYSVHQNLESGCSGRDISEKQHLNLDGKGPTRIFFLTSHIAVNYRTHLTLSVSLS